MVGPNMRPIQKDRKKDGGGRDSARDSSRRSRRSRSRSRSRERDRDRDRKRRRSRSRDRGRRRSRSRERDRARTRDDKGTEEVEEKGKKKYKAAALDKNDQIVKELYIDVDPLKNKKDKKQPLAVDEILQKKKEEEAAAARPVFMTKKMREQAALARRAEDVAVQKQRTSELEKQRRDFSTRARAERRRSSHRDQRERERERRAAEEKKPAEEREKTKVLNAIKEQYLTKKKEKKKITKPSDKFRFSFDWEATDDTSTDLNPLYQERADITLAFGRGKFAGVDRNVQSEKATIYDEIMEEHRQKHLGSLNDDKKQKKMAKLKKDKYKDRHWSDKPLTEMTTRDWRIFKEDFNITTKGGRMPLPLRNWEEGLLHPDIMKAIDDAGYKEPSPIQRQAIPIGMQHRDMIGIAETGSGKTCAFVIPMLMFITKLPPMTKEIAAEGPYSIILAPTRELAQQIDVECRKFSKHLGFKCMSIVGGGGAAALRDQGFEAANGVEVIIATPGRLNDMLERRLVALNQCTYVVLDEADRMIDLGFEPQVIAILDRMPVSNIDEEDLGITENTRSITDLTKLRITHMFSATMPIAVERMARKYMRKPAQVAIGRVGQVADKVEQIIMWVNNDNDKKRLLLQHLQENERDGLFIVFVNTKSTANVVAKNLEKLGIRAVALHGGKSQDQREESLDMFKRRLKTVLVATNVAGRGIDVPNVTHVINYDMPGDLESYTHRIGRTGRAGAKGTAISYLTNSDEEIMYDLKQMLQDNKIDMPRELAKHEAARTKPGTIAQKPKKRNEVLFLDI